LAGNYANPDMIALQLNVGLIVDPNAQHAAALLRSFLVILHLLGAEEGIRSLRIGGQANQEALEKNASLHHHSLS
jgi:hypothetical protein